MSVHAESVFLIIDAPLTEIELIAEPRESDAKGTSSRFAAVDETISVTKPLSGSISATIDDVPYVADFAEPYDLFASQLKE